MWNVMHFKCLFKSYLKGNPIDFFFYTDINLSIKRIYTTMWNMKQKGRVWQKATFQLHSWKYRIESFCSLTYFIGLKWGYLRFLLHYFTITLFFFILAWKFPKLCVSAVIHYCSTTSTDILFQNKESCTLSVTCTPGFSSTHLLRLYNVHEVYKTSYFISCTIFPSEM